MSPDLPITAESVEPGKERHPEVYGPELLKHLTGQIILDHEVENRYMQWWRADFAGFARLANPKMPSWNWDWILGACWMWIDPAKAGPWWVQLLESQCTGVSEINHLSCLMGTETQSNTYEAFRTGSVAAVRLWAIRTPKHEQAPAVLAWTGEYNRRIAGLYALGATHGPDPRGHKGAAGLWYDGDTVSPTGERSTTAHAYQNDMGPILSLMILTNLNKSKREDWPARTARLLVATPQGFGLSDADRIACRAAIPGDLDLAWYSKVLGSCRTLAPLEWLWWKGDDLTKLCVSRGPRLNTNTPKVFWSLRVGSQPMAFGFPWVGGRGNKALGDCEVMTGLVHAEGTAPDDAEAQIPARKPDHHLSLSREGFRVVS